MKVTVPDMTCNHCKMNITNALTEKGFSGVNIDLENKLVEAELGELSETDFVQAIEGKGYTVQK